MTDAGAMTDPMDWWREFNSAHARTLQALDRALVRAHRVTACELDVLQRIAATDTGSLRIQDLSELVLRSQSTLSRMVGRLEAEGLLTRTTYAKDRRGTLATLTPEGRVRLNDAQNTARQVLATLMQQPEPSGDRRR